MGKKFSGRRPENQPVFTEPSMMDFERRRMFSTTLYSPDPSPPIKLGPEFARMKNTSGGALAAGDVVVLKSTAAGDEITTTTTVGDQKVFGVVSETIANAAYGLVQVQGKNVNVKANGTDDIAVGDFLSTYSEAKIAQKASSADMAFAVAIEAYTTDDSSGVISVIIIKPRRMLSVASDIEVSELSEATYDDVQDYINFFGDRTYLTGCEITPTSPANGTVAIAAGTAWCKETDSDTAIGKFFNFTGKAEQTLTDAVTNIIYLDYNAGTPQIVVATSPLTYSFKQDHILLGVVFRSGNETHILQADPLGIQGDNRSHMMRVEEGASRSSGMATTATGTRNLAITAGVLHLGLNRKTTPPYTTPNAGTADATEANKLHDADGGFVATDVGKIVHNTTDDTYTEVIAYVDGGELTLRDNIFVSGEAYDLDIFSYWYYDGDLETPAWVEVPGSTAISNSQYNDVDTGLANLTANRYGVHWVYMDFDGHLHVVYGQGDYKANEAEEAGVPSSLPNIATSFAVLIAKIICQQGTDTLTITYPWTSVFTSSLATDHGSLGGLSDDDHTQYIKHALATAASDFLVASGSGVYVKNTLAQVRTLIKADTDIADAITKKHTEGDDQALGTLGTKATPVDADKVIHRNSESADALVTSTWTQVKAFFKTYLDTLYSVLGHTHSDLSPAHKDVTTGVHGVGAGAVVGTALTQTITNKTLIATTNVVEESTTFTSTSTPIPTGGSLRNFFSLTALAVNATFVTPSGTPANGNKLIIRVKDNGTVRTLGWDAIYRTMEFALPTTTTAGKTMYLGFIYNSADSKWDLVAINEEA